MKVKRNKLWRVTALLATTGLVVATPVIATSCGTSLSTETIAPVVKQDATITTNFESILKGFADGSDMNKAVSELLSTEQGKRQLIENYDSVTNKENVKVTVSGLDGVTKGWDGTSEYITWGESATKAIANGYSDTFTISSLGDLKEELSKEDTLKALLKASGVEENDLNNKKISLVDESKLGVQKIADSTIDLVHVNVKIDELQSEESVLSKSPNTQKTYDLGIPASNINLKLDTTKVSIQGNGFNVEQNINLDLQMGISTKVESSYSNEYVFTPREDTNNGTKDDLTIQELFTEFGWINSVPASNKSNEDITNLNSSKIGDDLGIFNVNFTSAKDITTDRIGSDNYEGMSFELMAKPKDGFNWEDGSKDSKVITIKDANVLIQDAGVKYMNFSDADPYVLEWNKIFEKTEKELLHQYPESLENLKNLLKQPDFFEEFQKAFMSYDEYKNDFNAVRFVIKNIDTDVTEIVDGSLKTQSGTTKKAYKINMTFSILPGHKKKEHCVDPGKNLVFKIVDTKPQKA